ncbi:hypothetical protein scyTo_0003484 [Scyliorhinus torazame]|uniref:Thrombospondin-like N-terminal domain-containing protein n=1 Tax=Scyliorhinus torazame TaxID=75743 RepID=A0A401PML3_SCYTO|nr:hypothetical protein [Scyliorhinus torazame]
MKHVTFQIAFLWVTIVIHLTRGKLVNKREDALCPTIETEELQSQGQHVEASGFDLLKSFSLTRSAGRKDSQAPQLIRMGRKLLVRHTQQIFPRGLPAEFSFVATFRLKRTTKKEHWRLWQITDQSGSVQASISIDGSRKVVEYNVKGASGKTLHLTFKKRELGSLFDRQWHKLAINVKSGSVSLYKDCKLVDSKRSEEMESIDVHGEMAIGIRVRDGTPVDFDLQQIMVYCNPHLIELETCCRVPGGLCSLKGDSSPSIVTSENLMRQKSTQSKPKSDNQKGEVPVAPEKGERGDPGPLGEKVKVSYTFTYIEI